MTETDLDELLDAWRAPAPPPSLRAGLRTSFPADRRRRLWGVPLRWIVACAASAGALAVGTSLVTDPMMTRFASRMEDGNWVITTRMIDPPIARLKYWMRVSEGMTGNGAVSWFDHSAGTCVGYRLTRTPLSGGEYSVGVEQLTLDEIRRMHPTISTAGRLLPLPASPAPRIVKLGESFDIDLIAVPHGERIYDRVVFSSQAPDSVNQHEPPEIRAQTLRLANPVLYIDGQLQPGPAGAVRSESHGPTVWFHLPNQGRYLIALDPQKNPRFSQAGNVNGATLEFALEGNQYRLESPEPIATGGERPVYVFHDEGFQINSRSGLAETVLFGSAGPAYLYAK
jgi:hypothetical protein